MAGSVTPARRTRHESETLDGSRRSSSQDSDDESVRSKRVRLDDTVEEGQDNTVAEDEVGRRILR